MDRTISQDEKFLGFSPHLKNVFKSMNLYKRSQLARSGWQWSSSQVITNA